MPLTLENAGALVPGGVSPRAIEQERNAMQQQQAPAQPKTLRVKVMRPFYYQSEPIEKNAIVELPRVFALEMIAAKKAEAVKLTEAAATSTAPAPEKKPGEGKEKK